MSKETTPRSLFILAALLRTLVPAPVAAATWFVDRPDDLIVNGCDDTVVADCSLRGAVLLANTTPGADEIVLPTGIFQLSIPGGDDTGQLGDLDLIDDVTLRAADGASAVIEGDVLVGFSDRLIDVRNGADVVVEGVRLRPTSTATLEGCVMAVQQASTATLRGVVVTANAALGSYAQCIAFSVLNNSALTFEESALAGFYRGFQTTGSGAQLTISDSTLVACEDGALFVPFGTATLSDSLLLGHGDATSGGVSGPRYGAVAAVGGSLEISRSTFRANVSWDRPGAALYVEDELVVLDEVIFEANRALSSGSPDSARGGAVAAGFGTTLQATAVIFRDNEARLGGALAIEEPGPGTFVQLGEFEGNTATEDGGAVWIRGDGSPQVVFDRTSWWNNDANPALGLGGALRVEGPGTPPPVLLRNSTLTRNEARFGGAVSLGSTTASVTLEHVTLFDNPSSVGALQGLGSVQAIGSLIDNGCSSALVTSFGGNVEGPGSSCGLNGPGDLVSASAYGLGSLGRFPNLPPTLLPEPGSQLLDRLNCTLTEDQRGVARPQAGSCDSGAVESLVGEESDLFDDDWESGGVASWSASSP